MSVGTDHGPEPEAPVIEQFNLITCPCGAKCITPDKEIALAFIASHGATCP